MLKMHLLKNQLLFQQQANARCIVKILRHFCLFGCGFAAPFPLALTVAIELHFRNGKVPGQPVHVFPVVDPM
jgi:hypothetical protein